MEAEEGLEAARVLVLEDLDLEEAETLNKHFYDCLFSLKRQSF